MPEQIGRYEIIHSIGKGNYGQVYKARMKGEYGFEKVVALKILNTTVNDHNRKEVRALINEARIGGFLKHSGIVDTYEFGEDTGKLFIAMEFVDGFTLGHLIQQLRSAGRYVPLGLIVEIGYSIAGSLAYAHERQTDDSRQALHLVHRDLKPENIMLSGSGEVKVLDFGIAVSAANMFRTTLKNMTKGTPAYMSPEQVMGVPDLDARSDLFGLGTVLVELITVDQLFDGKSWTDTMESVLRKDIRPVLRQIGELSPELMKLLASMLERDRDRRISSARKIAREMMQLRGAFPTGMTLYEFVRAINEENWDQFPRSLDEAREWHAPEPTFTSTPAVPVMQTQPELKAPTVDTLSELLTRQVDELLAGRGATPKRRSYSDSGSNPYSDSFHKEPARSLASADSMELDPAPSRVSGMRGMDTSGNRRPVSTGQRETAEARDRTPDRRGMTNSRIDYTPMPASAPSNSGYQQPPMSSKRTGTVSLMLRQRNLVAVLVVVQWIAILAMAAALVWLGLDRTKTVAGRRLFFTSQQDCTVWAGKTLLGQTPIAGLSVPETETVITVSCPYAQTKTKTYSINTQGDTYLGCWDFDQDKSCQ